MEIRNIAVVANAGAVDPNLVALASDLARRHHAVLTGIAAAEPPLVVMGMDGGAVAASVYSEQRAEIEAMLTTSKESFAAMVAPGVKHRWVQAIQQPEVAIINVALAVDLIVIGSPDQKAPLGQAIDVSAVLLGAGRPVLLAADGARRLKAARVLVAWKDTKEARRAIVDALPFLKAADDVAVVVVDEGNLAVERASMLDVVAWLQSHDVKAHGDVLPDIGGIPQTIVQAAHSAGADLIVSGAYGHSRLRQWVFGGMTRELLATPGINRFFSN